jgi:hypothetical protein
LSWEYVLKNIGEWEGCFRRHDAIGTWLGDIPSQIFIEGVDRNRSIHLTLRRYYPDANSGELVARDLSLDFSQPSAGAIFCPTGAFSEGALHTHTIPFGAELALIAEDRRLRLIQQYVDRQLNGLTLVTESRIGSNAVVSPPLQLTDWQGHWQGTATIVDRAGNHTSTVEISDRLVRLEEHKFTKIETIDSQLTEDTINLIADTNPPRYSYQRGSQTYQILCLNGGGYSVCPIVIQPSHPVDLELGWAISPTLRQRIRRSYDANGNWTRVMLIQEQLSET